MSSRVSYLTGAFASNNPLAEYPELIFAIIKIYLAQEFSKKLAISLYQFLTATYRTFSY